MSQTRQTKFSKGDVFKVEENLPIFTPHQSVSLKEYYVSSIRIAEVGHSKYLLEFFGTGLTQEDALIAELELEHDAVENEMNKYTKTDKPVESFFKQQYQ